MALIRDTKARARRIDWTYYRRPHPFRRWKRTLSIAVPTAAALFILAMAAMGDRRIYNSGGMSPAHSMLEKNCGFCHTSPWAQRYVDPEKWQAGLDAACLNCHDGPVHHANAADHVRGSKGHETASRCSQCHAEHKGAARLAGVSDRHCVSCHAGLKTTGPEPHLSTCPVGKDHAVSQQITGFSQRHPESALLKKQEGFDALQGQSEFESLFQSMRGKRQEWFDLQADGPDFKMLEAKATDKTRLRFNHAEHLDSRDERRREQIKAKLERVPRRGIRTQSHAEGKLTCADCHQPLSPGAYMAPVHYERHCRHCHPLERPEGITLAKDERVPHEEPVVLRDFLRSRFAQTGAADDELADRVARAEEEFYTNSGTGCRKCHGTSAKDVEALKKDLPEVLPTGVRRGPAGEEGASRRWFAHSIFNHEAHRAMNCQACHARADSSWLTSDVLLPSMKACLPCHGAGGRAPSTCATCHLYHDRGRAKEGKFRPENVTK